MGLNMYPFTTSDARITQYLDEKCIAWQFCSLVHPWVIEIVKPGHQMWAQVVLPALYQIAEDHNVFLTLHAAIRRRGLACYVVKCVGEDYYDNTIRK